MDSNKIVATFSRGIAKKDTVLKQLDLEKIQLNPRDSSLVDYVVGWGKKPNTRKARAYAKKNNLIFYSLEQGFLHSMGQEVLGYASLSLVKDKLGIYYDATHTSDLEEIILDHNDEYFDSETITRAQNAIKRITHNNISKYNNGVHQIDDSLFRGDEVVLVVDQIKGDMSLQYGYVDESTFDMMLQVALDEHPNAQIIIKTHPDVIAGKKKGSIKLPKSHSRISIVSENINPLLLLKKVDAVYVATSQMGFEALMLGKQVVCFGVPFYAGWGLTDDRADKALPVWNRRNKKRTLLQVFAAAYIHYPVYLNPDLNQLCELEDILSYFEQKITYKLQQPTNRDENQANWFRQLMGSFFKRI